MKLSVIIPAYNERSTIEAVVRRVQAVNLGPIEKEIIVIDDGSRDGTTDILKALSGIRHILHERNAGKGAALTTGFQAATGDIVLIQDADLEYHPEDYRTVIQPIVDGTCDAVMGSRFLLYKPKFFGKRRSPYLTHYIGNKLIVVVTNLLYGQRFTDYEGCYKAFTRTVLASTPVEAKGFEFDNELICKLMRKGARIVEVPIHYTPRTYAHGKKINWKHGLIILWTIIKWRFLHIPVPAR
jgi:glycosyltransferase involved in cell wall biosynthesis